MSTDVSTKPVSAVERAFPRQLNMPALMTHDEYRALYASVMRAGAATLQAWIEKLSRTAGVVKPTTVVVLGSGLGALVQQVELLGELSFEDVGLPQPSADGHAGRFILGILDGKTIVMQSGRLHCYENWHPAVVALSVRMLAVAGLRTFVLTNAAGSLDATVRVGDIVVLSGDRGGESYSPSGGLGDSHNFSGPFGPKFYPANEVYDTEVQQRFIDCARSLALPVHRGVYQFMPGPRYEQVGEIREFVRLRKQAIAAGDLDFAVAVVGMSTAPEASALAQLRAAHGFTEIRTLGISNVTNIAAGIEGSIPSSEEVLSCAPLGGGRIIQALRALLG